MTYLQVYQAHSSLKAKAKGKSPQYLQHYSPQLIHAIIK